MKRVLAAALCLLVLAFFFVLLPTGESADDVVDAYVSTTRYTEATQSGMVMTKMDLLEKTDPLLQNLDTQVESSGGYIDYIWVNDDGAVVPFRVSDTFPVRSGPDKNQDNPNFEANSSLWHLGTDFSPLNQSDKSKPIWQVAIMAGEVVYAGYTGDNPLWGWCVITKCTDYLYIRYGHMGWGVGSYSGGPSNYSDYSAWYKTDKSQSSLTVQVGDKVTAGQIIGALGTTGASSAPHAHIELILSDTWTWSERANWGSFGERPCYGGANNLLTNKMQLSEINWYPISGKGQEHYWGSRINKPDMSLAEYLEMVGET